MANKIKLLSLICAVLLAYSTGASAAPKPIKATLSKSLGDGYKIVAVSTDNELTTATISGKTIKITPPAANSRLYVLSPTNKVSGEIVAKVCTKASSGKDKGKFVKCSSKTLVRTVFKAGADLGKLKSVSDQAFVSSVNGDKYKKIALTDITAQASNYIPLGIPSLGLVNSIQTTNNINKNQKLLRQIRAKADVTDSDSDGLIDPFDSDDDGDKILDNYDSAPGSASAGSSSFHVFSNLKLEIEQSLNLHATGLTSTKIDTALQNVQTLAMQLAGDTSATVELDCGSLGYCSSGGTGTYSNVAFPGSAGGTYDSDSDGYGTMSRGGSGDFQLKTNATSSSISAGDAFIEHVTDTSSVESLIPGMLNFVFYSTPALKSIAVNSGSATTIDYTATPVLGSMNNCLSAPATGTVTLSIVGWRPQRAGVSGAGEAAYVDIGLSSINADIPNGACSGGTCAPQGPGHCKGTAFTTTDTNLATATEGLTDNKADQDADSSNTYSFTLDLTACLAAASSGAVSWNASETISIDLQFQSRDGDNAAQKFCITRAAV